MKKIINLIFVFLFLFSSVNAITINEREEILKELNLVRGSEQAFRDLLGDLNSNNIDLSKEKTITSVIKEKAKFFNINLKDEYPNIKLYNNFLIYFIIFIIIIILMGVFMFFINKRRIKNEI